MRIRWAGPLARKVVNRFACRNLVERAVGMRPFALPQRRWEGNVTVGLKQMRWLAVNLIRRAQDKGQWWVIVNTKINVRIPSKTGDFFD